MRVEDILLRGAQRWDEIQRFRTVFNNPGIVLRHTSRQPPPDVFRNRMARRIFESINGERTVAEILLHAHSSEYIVTKFLYELHRAGVVEVAGVKEVEAAPRSLESVVPLEEALPPGRSPAPARSPLPSASTRRLALAAAAAPIPAANGRGRRPRVRAAPAQPRRVRLRARDPRSGVQGSARGRGAAPPARRGGGLVRREGLPALPPARPRSSRSATSVESLTAEKLSPTEFFLLSRIDGTWDVKSIIQITPIREVDVLRTLKRMREKGLIDLKDPVAASA